MSKKKMWFTILGLVFGILLGIYIQPVISGDNIYDQIRKFNEVLATVQKNYVDDVDTPKLVEAAIVGMLNELDPHSVYIPAEQQKRVEEDFRGSFQGIGVEFDVIRDTITIVSPIAGGPSEALGILAGDKIVKIDGENSVGMPREDVPKKLRGPKGTHVEVLIVRAGTKEPLKFDITRDNIPLYTVDASFVDEDGTAYMAINRFAEPTYDEMMQNLDRLSQNGMKRLILDLRGNPGGYMEKAIRMVDEFIPGGKTIVYTKSEKSGQEERFTSESGQAYEKLPLIVLINQGSASASEIVSGAVQDLDRGLIVGQTSFGKGLVQRQFGLPDGSAFRLTIARYYTPSGRLIQRPYDKGRDEYYSMSDRAEDEEGDNLNHDHDAADSTRPVFKTASGRKVLGGGGVTPDYVVKLDTLTKLSIDIIRKNLIWEYTEQLLNSQGQDLRKKYQGNFPEFSRNFQISDKMFDDFMKLAQAKEITVDPKMLALDKENLKTRLKARIARGIWGNNEFYQVALKEDKQYQTARTLFPEAMKVARLTSR
jgi:carboxyl-terminal processing protease